MKINTPKEKSWNIIIRFILAKVVLNMGIQESRSLLITSAFLRGRLCLYYSNEGDLLKNLKNICNCEINVDMFVQNLRRN